MREHSTTHFPFGTFILCSLIEKGCSFANISPPQAIIVRIGCMTAWRLNMTRMIVWCFAFAFVFKCMCGYEIADICSKQHNLLYELVGYSCIFRGNGIYECKGPE